MAALADVEYMPFIELRDYLATTDSTLSKHTSALEELEYVKIKKLFIGKRPQNRLALTKNGLQAWKAHLAALQEIASGGLS